jgi:hypothetical protein
VGGFVARTESLEVIEEAWVNAVDYAPQIRQTIFDGGAGHCDPKVGIHALCGIGHPHAWVLDFLRLVTQHDRKPHQTEVTVVVAQRLIGG